MRFKKIIVGLITCIFLILIVLVAKQLLKVYAFPIKHEKVIMEYSAQNDLDPFLVLSVIKAESKFDADAKSHKDAVGLMQITPDTASWVAHEMGLTDFSQEKLYDEEYNIKMGCWYLNNLKTEFEDTDLVIAAYNAGRGRVNGWLKDENYSKDGKKLDYIPYKETKRYVDRVKVYYQIYKVLY